MSVGMFLLRSPDADFIEDPTGIGMREGRGDDITPVAALVFNGGGDEGIGVSLSALK